MAANKAATAKPKLYTVVQVGDDIKVIEKSELTNLRKTTAEEDKKAKKKYDEDKKAAAKSSSHSSADDADRGHDHVFGTEAGERGERAGAGSSAQTRES